MAKIVPSDPPQSSNRDDRLAARHFLNMISTVKGCRDCGRAPVNPGGAIGVRSLVVNGSNVAGFSGLSSCGRIWLCPVCNSKVMARRAIDIGLTLAWAEANGLHVLWGSLTFKHSRDSDLRPGLKMQQRAWRRVMSSKRWRQEAEAKNGDRVGYIRAAEITDGQNGWHPHFHPIILMSGSAANADEFAAWVVEAWVDAIREEGGEADVFAKAEGSPQQLLRLEPGEAGHWLAEYVTKQGFVKVRQLSTEKLAIESVWSQSKVGPKIATGRAAKTYAHWTLLSESHTLGRGGEVKSTRQLARWWELEEATHGHRMIMWSRDLRNKVGLGVESTDEEEAERELGSIEDTVCFITPAGWRVVRDAPALRGLILTTLEKDGWAALRAVLDANGVEWSGTDEAIGGTYAGAAPATGSDAETVFVHASAPVQLVTHLSKLTPAVRLEGAPLPTGAAFHLDDSPVIRPKLSASNTLDNLRDLGEAMRLAPGHVPITFWPPIEGDLKRSFGSAPLGARSAGGTPSEVKEFMCTENLSNSALWSWQSLYEPDETGPPTDSLA